MTRPKIPICIITRTDDIYTVVCPLIDVIHFSSKDKNEAIQMAKDGIESYLKLYPGVFDHVEFMESYKV